MQTNSCLFVSLWAALLLFSGVTLNTLLGRKGSLEKMKDYWDVGFYLGANILTNEHKKVIEASEKLYRLKPPIWWDSRLIITRILIPTRLFSRSESVLCLYRSTSLVCFLRFVASIMETFILYRQFAKLPEVKYPKQDTVDLWMELLLQTYKPTVSTDRCPVRRHKSLNELGFY